MPITSSEAAPEFGRLADDLRRDGFVLLPGFFARARAEKARREMEAWYERDLADRRAKGVTDYNYEGAAGRTALTPPMHNMIDIWGRSPTLDAMVETLLTDPVATALTRALAGGAVKARAFTCRWMNGAHDPPPAHDWHRDSPGAFNFGILLDDVPAQGNAATGFIRGSHWYPYNPLWNTLGSERYEGPKAFRRINVFNHLVKWKMEANHAEACGRQGDAYLFTNELWHGRQPNLHGRRGMVALFALYPASYPFPAGTRRPEPAVVERLPPALREALREDQPGEIDPSCLIEQIRLRRGEPGPLDLFYWARLERRAAEACSRLLPRLNRALARS